MKVEGFTSFFVVLTVVLTASALVSCSRKSDAAAESRQRASNAPIPVQASKVGTRDVPVEIQGVGNVQAYSMVSIRPQITGPIMKVHFAEGQDVKTGDLLFTIDPRPFAAALNQAQANLKRDEAQLISARMEFLRTSNLFVSKIASQQDYDTALAGFASAEATTIADSAAISNVQVSLGYTDIRSPIDGRTGAINVKVGNVVKSPDDVLLTITQLHPIFVAFSVPEQNLSVIRRRMAEASLAVMASVPGDAATPRGTLSFVNNTVDTNTGTILLKATFSNEDNALWPGQFVQATLTLSNQPSATVVPSQAVQSGQNGDYIFVVKSDDTVEVRTNVVIGVASEGLTVILNGVKPGETVVTDGQLRLTPGAKVSVKQSESAGSTNTTSTNP